MQVQEQKKFIVFRILANAHSRRILSMCRGAGVEESIKFEQLGFSRKQWYNNLTRMKRAGLVHKIATRYMQTTYGTAIDDAVNRIMLIEADRKKLKAIDVLKQALYSDQEIEELLAKKEESER